MNRYAICEYRSGRLVLVVEAASADDALSVAWATGRLPNGAFEVKPA